MVRSDETMGGLSSRGWMGSVSCFFFFPENLPVFFKKAYHMALPITVVFSKGGHELEAKRNQVNSKPKTGKKKYIVASSSLFLAFSSFF